MTKYIGKLGAQIELKKGSAFIQGGLPLSGNWVHATDVRAGTCLVMAGLKQRGAPLLQASSIFSEAMKISLGAFNRSVRSSPYMNAI